MEKQILADIVESTMSGEKQPLDEEEVAEDEAAPSVAGEEIEEATESVAGEELVGATESVAGEGLVEATESVAGEVPGEAAESVAGEEEDNEVPEMAREYNRFAMDLDVVEEPQPPEAPIQALEKRIMVLGNQMRERREAFRKLEEEYRCPHLEAPENKIKIVEDSGNTVGEERRLGSSGDEDAVIGGVIVARGTSTKRKNAARRRKRKLIRSEREEEEMKSRW